MQILCTRLIITWIKSIAKKGRKLRFLDRGESHNVSKSITSYVFRKVINKIDDNVIQNKHKQKKTVNNKLINLNKRF